MNRLKVDTHDDVYSGSTKSIKEVLKSDKTNANTVQALNGSPSNQITTDQLIWNYETIEDQLPELKELDFRNTRLNKLSEKLADAIIKLFKCIRSEVRI